MKAADLVAKWQGRRADWQSFGALVSGAAVAEEILSDLAALSRSEREISVSLREASSIGGYSIDHLQRLVAKGDIHNVGRKHRPRIRRADVPVKPGYHLPNSTEDVLSERRRIVASVTTDREEQS
jgi:hypothetical protein